MAFKDSIARFEANGPQRQNVDQREAALKKVAHNLRGAVMMFNSLSAEICVLPIDSQEIFEDALRQVRSAIRMCRAPSLPHEISEKH